MFLTGGEKTRKGDIMNLQQNEKYLDFIISEAYDTLDTDDKRTNPFETEQSDKRQDDYIAKYFPDYPHSEDSLFDLIDLVVEERKAAFSIGFRSALKMLDEMKKNA